MSQSSIFDGTRVLIVCECMHIRCNVFLVSLISTFGIMVNVYGVNMDMV